jgi:hypothetical protein
MKAQPVELVAAPRTKEEADKLVDEHKPVIFSVEDYSAQAMRVWDFEYLDSRYGDVEVAARRQTTQTDGSSYFDKEKVPLRECLKAPTDTRGYFYSEQRIFSDFPGLRAELPVLPFVGSKSPPLEVGFIGAQTYTPLHFHSKSEAFVIQIRGSKRFWLWPPSDIPRLYCRKLSPNKSQVPFRDRQVPVSGEYPKFGKTHPVEAVVSAGQALFVPQGWTHAIWSEGAENISVVTFFPSPRRLWGWPMPGLWLVMAMYRARVLRVLNVLLRRMRRIKGPRNQARGT